MPYFDFNYNHYINVRQEITIKKLIAQNSPKPDLDLTNLKLDLIKSVTIPDIWQLTKIEEGSSACTGYNHWYVLNYNLIANPLIKLTIGRNGCKFFVQEDSAKEFYDILNLPIDKLPKCPTVAQMNSHGMHYALFDENMWFNKYTKQAKSSTFFIDYEIHKLEITEVNNKRVLYSKGIRYNRFKNSNYDINEGYEPEQYVANTIIKINF